MQHIKAILIDHPSEQILLRDEAIADLIITSDNQIIKNRFGLTGQIGSCKTHTSQEGAIKCRVMSELVAGFLGGEDIIVDAATGPETRLDMLKGQYQHFADHAEAMV
jgi:hypothetical protein